jgi:alkaline phosphatase D
MCPLRGIVGPAGSALNYGPHLDVFMLDERSYRGPNGANLQRATGAKLLPRSRPARLAETRC